MCLKRTIWMCIVLWVAAVLPAAGLVQADEPKRVVVLNATDPYLPAFLAIDSAMREAIRAAHSTPTELYAETLDMARFPRPLIEDNLFGLLRTKYHGLHVDIVVAAETLALDFVERHGGEIWPGAKIVFYSVPAETLRMRSLNRQTIGIPTRLDIAPTVDLALRLRPATRRLVVVAGDAELDSRFLLQARPDIERYAGRLEIHYLVGLPVADVVKAVRALSSDSVVFYLTMFRDGAGTPLVPRDVLQRIAAASSVPVFGVFETYLGHGIVAGSIASYAAHGRRAGELVVRVLNGEDPAAIGVQQPVASGCIADWRQLRRWSIGTGLVPEDCEVRFREVTAWDLYRWQILAVLSVIFAQGALIAALLLSRRRLRRTQTVLQDEQGRRNHAETIAGEFRERLARFGREHSLGTMATTIAHEINQPLIAIQNYAQAARRRLEADHDASPKLLELFAKIEGQAERAGTITQRVRSLVGAGDSQLLPAQLKPLLDEVIRIMEPEAEANGCRIVFEPAGDLPEVLADALALQLVLVNLLHNAMRSVRSGDRYDRNVVIDARVAGEAEMQISVTDRGAGVSPDRVQEIFEPLYSGAGKSLGMGLAICRDIITAHGGRIWHEPNPAGGAIFRFTLRTVRS